MTVSVTPLSDALGAEVHGIDPRRPLDGETTQAVVDALHAHVVLLFRDAATTEAEQIRFAESFGELGRRSGRIIVRATEGGFHTDPRIMLVSNIRDSDGEPIGSLPDGEMWFHHDTSFVEVQHKITMLNAIDIPSKGGNTMFANSYSAYEAVPGALKEKLAGRRVLQVFNYKQTETLDAEAIDRGEFAGCAHVWKPIFPTHPETGRAILYVSRLISARIDGLERAESDAILEQLFDIAEQRRHVYEHVWHGGDLVMWDNYASAHARTDFDGGERRLLRRCTVVGQAL